MNTEEKSNMYPKGNLKPLTEVNEFEFAEGFPDIRGWEVFDTDSHLFGKVRELIVDPEKKKVRYLDIKLDKKLSRIIKDPVEDHGDHILVPIGKAAVVDKDDHIVLNGIHHEILVDYPIYSGNAETITRSYEHALVVLLSGQIEHHQVDENFYEQKSFDESKISRKG